MSASARSAGPASAFLADAARAAPQVLGLGAQTVVGRSAPAAAAAVRAGIARRAKHPYLVDRFGMPVYAARVPWLPAHLPIADRLRALARDAALEALQPLADHPHASGVKVALLLALPAVWPGFVATYGDALRADLRAYLPRHLAVASAEAVGFGHVAGIMAMERACALLGDGPPDACLVGGVESYLDPTTIDWLDRTGRLRSERNPWGFTPGEAAGFVLLGSPTLVERLSLHSFGAVLGAATRTEPTASQQGAGVCTGEGLSEALRAALSHRPDAEVPVDNLVYDFNGQPHRGEELGFAATRLAGALADPGRAGVPAISWGDVGAASGTLFTALAVIAGQRGYAAGPLTLAWTSSLGAERSAVLLYVPVGREEGL